MSLSQQDRGHTWHPEQCWAYQSGTMTSGEEELSKRFFMLKREGDTTVILTADIIYLEQLKGINRVRIGEEQEIVHLIDYLTNSTVRE